MIKMPELTAFFRNALWTFGISLVTLLVFLWLFVIGGNRYGVDKTEEHSENFASVVSEGHGPTTIFLWLCYAAVLIWTIYYFWVNGQQFWILFASHA
jgi:hypothetical protein